jgi:chemotaxis protein methyltransferase CheR
MMRQTLEAARWSQLSELVENKLGLHFPRERREELRRATVQAARELGVQATDWPLLPLPTPTQWRVLASHLTVGETYFFRDSESMRALAGTVLPELIASGRRRPVPRLRIWSAGCCTGEEVYSIAMLLDQALPDLAEWNISITGTDINPDFLRKAEAGIYGEWSFRGVPPGVKERYFTRRTDGRWAIAPHIRGMVNFRFLNLAEDSYPSPRTDTHAIDLILCRNVLMYFSAERIRKVAGNLRNALSEGGWLAVAPIEASQAVFAGFATVNLPGAIFYRKRGDMPLHGHVAPPQAPRAPVPDAFESPIPAPALAPAPVPANVPLDPVPLPVLARERANEGRHREALALCDEWILADKLNAAAHYLRANVLAEQGDAEQARSCLQRAIYLQSDFVLAHFALGNLAHAAGRHAEAARYFANTQELLTQYRDRDVLPESDGLTAAGLAMSLGTIRASAGVTHG